MNEFNLQSEDVKFDSGREQIFFGFTFLNSHEKGFKIKRKIPSTKNWKTPQMRQL